MSVHDDTAYEAWSSKRASGGGGGVRDLVVAADAIDRLVRHDEVVAMKGDSHRFKDRDLEVQPR